MARSSDEGADAIYEIHSRWLTEVLGPGDSLFSPGTRIWTAENLEQLDLAFIGQPDLTKNKTYLAKLEDQLAGSPPAVVQLMAELHAIHFLIIWSGAMSSTKKASDVDTILSWRPDPPSIPGQVVDAFERGLANPGQWMLTRRDLHVAWLLRFSRRWKDLGEAEQQRYVSDPWAMRDLVATIETEGESVGAARLALLHLSHPDTFERVISETHKGKILDRFAAIAVDPSGDPDKRLLAARRVVADDIGEHFEWYDPRLRPLWDKDLKRWTAFLGWCERLHELPDFDPEERDYKLVAAEHMGAARHAVSEGRDEWPDLLSKCFSGSVSNLTSFRAHAPFLGWVRNDPSGAQGALQHLWSGAGEPGSRVDSFGARLPADLLSTPGARLNIASYLLTALGAKDSPPFRISAFRRAWALAGWTEDGKGLTGGELYDAILRFCDEMVDAASTWRFPLRDRLDAQSVVWEVTKLEQKPAGWSEDDWQAFTAFRLGVTGTNDPEDDDPREAGKAVEGPVPPEVYASESVRRRRRYEQVRSAWLEDEQAQTRFADSSSIVDVAAPMVTALLDDLAETGDLRALQTAG